MSGEEGDDAGALVRRAQRLLGSALSPADGATEPPETATGRASDAYREVVHAALEGSADARIECRRILGDRMAMAALDVDRGDLLATIDAHERSVALDLLDPSGPELLAILRHPSHTSIRHEVMQRVFTAAASTGDVQLTQVILRQPDAPRAIHEQLLSNSDLRARLAVSRPQVVGKFVPSELVRVLDRSWTLDEVVMLWRTVTDPPRRHAIAPFVRQRAIEEGSLWALNLVLADSNDTIARETAPHAVQLAGRRAIGLSALPQVISTEVLLQIADDQAELRNDVRQALDLLPADSEDAARWTRVDAAMNDTLRIGELRKVTADLESAFAGPVRSLAIWQRYTEHRRRLLRSLIERSAPELVPERSHQVLEYATRSGPEWGRQHALPDRSIYDWERPVLCALCSSWLAPDWRFCGSCGSRLERAWV